MFSLINEIPLNPKVSHSLGCPGEWLFPLTSVFSKDRAALSLANVTSSPLPSRQNPIDQSALSWALGVSCC